MPIADTREPVLLTPGPLTTTVQTKHAQLRDFGSRDLQAPVFDESGLANRW